MSGYKSTAAPVKRRAVGAFLFLARQIIVLPTARQSRARTTQLIFLDITYPGVPLVILVSATSAFLSSNISFWGGKDRGGGKPACLPSDVSVIAHELEFASTNPVPIFLAIVMQINTPKSELLRNAQNACTVGLLASFPLFFFFFNLKKNQTTKRPIPLKLIFPAGAKHRWPYQNESKRQLFSKTCLCLQFLLRLQSLLLTTRDLEWWRTWQNAAGTAHCCKPASPSTGQQHEEPSQLF